MESLGTLPLDLATPLLKYYAARYVISKKRGHVILAGFDDVNAALLGAWHICEVLQRIGILARVGMHWGNTVVHIQPLTSCIAMIGAGVQGAVHLARVATFPAILITAGLRYHPKVKQDHFVFIQQQRCLRTDGERPSAPQTLSCYVMTHVSTNI